MAVRECYNSRGLSCGPWSFLSSLHRICCLCRIVITAMKHALLDAVVADPSRRRIENRVAMTLRSYFAVTVV
eukprot:5300838-Amphidinium_carterae.1